MTLKTTTKFQFRHAMIRVLDLQKSIHFYTQILGMQLLRQNDYAEGRFTLAFIGYGDESEHTVIELTHNWDQTKPYEMGNGFGHFALGVEDIYAVCEELRQAGADIVREPGPMKGGTTEIAFIKDPDGYLIELIELASL